jgi:hypothetical protein
MGVCGEHSGTVRGLCGGLWWTEWQCKSYMWGFALDRVAQYQVYVGVCGGQNGTVIGLCGDLW